MATCATTRRLRSPNRRDRPMLTRSSLSAPVKIRACCPQGRNQPEDDSGKSGKRDREQHDPVVQRDREIHRQRERDPRPADRDGAQMRDGVTADSAEQRQHHALGEQLPHQASAARADGEPGGDFLLPRRSARQQQVGNVGAGRAQHQGGHAQQHQEEHDDHLAKARVDLAGAFDVKPAIHVGGGIGRC